MPDVHALLFAAIERLRCTLLDTIEKLPNYQEQSRQALVAMIRNRTVLSAAEFGNLLGLCNGSASKQIASAAQHGEIAAHRLEENDFPGALKAIEQGNYQAGEANREIDLATQTAKANARKKNTENISMEAEARHYWLTQIKPLGPGLTRKEVARRLTDLVPIKLSTALTYQQRWEAEEREAEKHEQTWAKIAKEHPDLARFALSHLARRT